MLLSDYKKTIVSPLKIHSLRIYTFVFCLCVPTAWPYGLNSFRPEAGPPATLLKTRQREISKWQGGKTNANTDIL